MRRSFLRFSFLLVKNRNMRIFNVSGKVLIDCYEETIKGVFVTSFLGIVVLYAVRRPHCFACKCEVGRYGFHWVLTAANQKEKK